MLVFERDPESGEIQIHVDEEGLSLLTRSLERLRGDKSDHDHLRTPSWAGWELSEEVQGKGHEIVHHVSIHFWHPKSGPTSPEVGGDLSGQEEQA